MADNERFPTSMINVTDHRTSTAPASLASLPEALATLLDQQAPLVLLLNHDGVIEGADAPTSRLLGSALSQWWPPEDAERLTRWLSRAVQHGESIDFICHHGEDTSVHQLRGRVQVLHSSAADKRVVFTLYGAVPGSAPRVMGGVELRPDPTMPSAFIGDGRRAAERLHFAEYGARFATWEFDTERCVLLAGSNYNELHGLPPHIRELTLADILALIHEDDHAAVKAVIAGLLRDSTSPTALSVDARVKLPGGELRWMEARFASIPTDAGTAPRIFGISLDITARKAMEASLRDSRAWLDLAMSSIGMVLWDRDLHTDRFRSSGNYGRFHGLEGDRREWSHEDFLTRVVPEDHGLMHSAFDATCKYGHDYAPKFRISLPDGSVRWLESRGRIQRDAAGRPERLVGVTWDISARQQSEQRLLGIAELVPGMVYQYRRAPDGSYSHPYCSEGVRSIFGFGPEEIREDAAVLIERLHDDDRARIIESIEISAATLTQWREEYRVQGPDGAVHWLIGHANPLRESDGGVVWYGHIMDISARKCAEMALRESEARLTLALSAARMMSWFWDVVSDCITTSSREFAPAVGLPDGPLTMNMVLEVTHPEEREAIREQVAAMVKEPPGTVVVIENRFVFQSGKTRWIETRARGHCDPAGQFLGYLCVSIDISARKDVERERERMQRNLQQAQKMEAIGLLTGGIAHDFNNILASILGYSGLALQRFAHMMPAKLVEYVREVEQAGERGHELVNQMLAFSRGEGTELRSAPLPPLIEQALKMVRPTLPSSLDFKIDYALDLPAVMTNAVQLQQIIVNLCINARDALQGTGTIGIRLYRATRSGAYCASCHNSFDGDYAVLSLADDGPGIALLVRERIFEPFFSTKSASGGTGMGLAMVHGIVHCQGGHIMLDSAPGQGTRFDIHFPLATPNSAGSTAVVSARPLDKAVRRARVLVVDDERAVGGFIAELLAMHDYAVVVESDALRALAQLRNAPHDFDIVITDQTMPQLSGAQLAVAALALRPELPVILISGYSAIIDAEQAACLGVRSFLHKPIKADVLLQAVYDALAAPPATTDAAQ